MSDLYLEKLLRRWIEELVTKHHHVLQSLNQYVGKQVDTVTCLKPSLVMYDSKKKLPPIGVFFDNKKIEFYIFKNSFCKRAFSVSESLINFTLSEELMNGFVRFFQMTEFLEQDPECKKVRPNALLFNRFRHN